MNLAPLLDVAASIVSLTVAGAVPVVVPKLLALMHITASAQQEASLENTITSSIGKAIAYGEKAGDPLLQNVTIKNSALGAAVAFAVDDAPEQLKALGYTPQSIAEVIDARITHALATTPTVVATPAVPPSADALKTAAMLEKAGAPVEASPMAAAPA
jgi:hypothetical protein